MKSLLYLIAGGVFALLQNLTAQSGVTPDILRIPYGGIQPRVEIGPSGTIHLVYFKGNPMEGDVFYVKRGSNSEEWSQPIQVNHRPGSAVAAGTIRGPQMALGRGERIHVAWMGSGKVAVPGKKEGDHPSHPMLYSRLSDDGQSFEEERDLLTWTAGLDGGGTVAADQDGNVYVAWHGKPAESATSEYGRSVYVTRSDDDGKTFERETQANPRLTGACGCCGMRGFADSRGRLHVLYRMANETSRDMGLLVSEDHSQTFVLRKVNGWEIQACPMSSAAFSEGHSGVLIATETEGRVEARLVRGISGAIRNIPGLGNEKREGKHPSVSMNQRGDTILAWAEGSGWKKGGNLKWQIYSSHGAVLASSRNDELPIPEWSFVSTALRADGRFILVY